MIPTVGCFEKMRTHEVYFEINGLPVYVRVTDPYDELTDRQLKSRTWKHLKKEATVEIRRNI
jgi:hypothetical protein